MQAFLDFFSMSDPNVRYVVIGTSCIMASSAFVGTFTFLQKKSLIGDAISHAVLPGVCLSFILSGSKSALGLAVGAFISGWVSLNLIEKIPEYTRLKKDASIAIVLSTTFGLGMLLLTYIQQSRNASQVGLNNFMLGKVIALGSNDIFVLSILSLVIITVTSVLFKEYCVVSFDKEFASCIGMPVRYIELCITSTIVLGIVIGIRAVGVLLMSATLITPAAAARFWTNDVRKMIVIASLIGIMSGIIGAFISYLAPAMATGPWIVIVSTIFAYLSFLFAPERGIVGKYVKRIRYKNRVIEENVLKFLYESRLKHNDTDKSYMLSEIVDFTSMKEDKVKNAVKNLIHKSMINKSYDRYTLSDIGMVRGQEVLKLHHLWEFYLQHYLRIKPDHVHDDAEGIEHVLTPELSYELENLMKKYSFLGKN